jgi:hypothetical protein
LPVASEVRRVGRPSISTSRTSRPSRRAALLVPILILVTGCALVSPPVAPRASHVSRTPEPIVVPSEPPDVGPTLPPDSPTGPDFTAAADALADLDSYRVALTATGLVASSASDGRVTMSSTLLQGDHPAASFTMSGVDGFALGRLEGIAIDDQAWLKEGDGTWRASPGGTADFDAAYNAVSPIDLATGFEGLSPSLVPVGSETLDGIATQHVRASASDDSAQAAGLSAGSVDLWVATNAGELVRLIVSGTWNVDGTDTPVTLRIDVSHVNDRANVVKPPG